MSIQWFPGHMTSARKKAAKTLAMADVVVEVLDARLPQASSNPMIHELRAFRQRFPGQSNSDKGVSLSSVRSSRSHTRAFR